MRRLTVLVTTCGVLMGALAGVASAHRPGDPPHQLYQMGDLRLENGQVIKDFAISYVTHGTLNAKKSNAILMVTALSGNHHRLDFLIGPGKALDSSKYFIVCTDAISNGLTTSPSNSKVQPRMHVPALRHAGHGPVAVPPPQGQAGHRARGHGDRAIDGRDAGAAVGCELSRLHG